MSERTIPVAENDATDLADYAVYADDMLSIGIKPVRFNDWWKTEVTIGRKHEPEPAEHPSDVEMTTYLTIGVHVRKTWEDGVNEQYVATGIDLGDDGDPGPWGNTYVRNTEDGTWLDDHQAQEVAYPMLEDAIELSRNFAEVNSALRRIEQGLRTPEWFVGMLEDIAEIVNGVDRFDTTVKQDESLDWGRH